MKKSYKINLKNNSVAIYSPSNFNIKEGTNFLQEKLYEIRDVEEVINNSKMIVLMLDEACECNFHFCDEEVCDDVLNNYYSYFKRGIEVKNNTLLITDTKKLESFSSLDMNNTFELENGYYNVHFFSRYDNNVYVFFEKVLKKPKLNVRFDYSYEIITTKENKRIILSADYNSFMFNNYSLITKELIDNTFKKDKNNFVYNLGSINITSGKLAIFDPLSIDGMDKDVDEENYLNKTFEIGKYKVKLAMRKTENCGTYITGVKIVFSKNEVEKYEIAKTISGKEEFSALQYYGAIGDFDSLDKYNNIFQSFKFLPQKDNKLINDFNKNSEQHKDLIDKYNYFMLWDIPTLPNNIAIFSVELGIKSYKAYYGLDKDDNVVELVIPLIRNEIFSHKEFEISKNKEEVVGKYVDELRNVIGEYIRTAKEEQKEKLPTYLGIPEYVSCKIEEIIFNIIDLKLTKEAVSPFLEFLDDFSNIDFYTKSDAFYYLLRGRYDCKDLLYETLLKNPTPYKIYLVARYLYQDGYDKKENASLLNLLKELRKSKDKEVRRAAKKRYDELVEEKKKKNKKRFNIIFYISMFFLLLSIILPDLDYKILIDNKNYNYLIRYIYSTDLKYEVYYNLPGGDFENTKMQKNEAWFNETKDLNNTRRFKLKIYNENFDKFLQNLKQQREITCNTNTEYSRIKCYDIIEKKDYAINNIKYYYFTYSFVENDSFDFTYNYLIYKLDDNNFVSIYNDSSNFKREEFLEITSDMIAAIKVEK